MLQVALLASLCVTSQPKALPPPHLYQVFIGQQKMFQSHDPAADLSVLLVSSHWSIVRGFGLLHFQISFNSQPDTAAAAAAATATTAAADAADAAAVAGCEAVAIATHSLETS